MALRLIPRELMTLEQIGLPPSVRQLLELPRGLILVTGPTGSGKTTSLASMLNVINETKAQPHHHHRGPDRVLPRTSAAS